MLGQINWVLFVEEGFRGNAEEYYDPRNSYLNEVLDRKTGIPISLSVLYAAVAARVGPGARRGEPAGALHAPGRPGRARPLFVDPFHAAPCSTATGCERIVASWSAGRSHLSDASSPPAGRGRSSRGCSATSRRSTSESHDYPSALPVARRLAALDPRRPDEQRDLGMLCLPRRPPRRGHRAR